MQATASSASHPSEQALSARHYLAIGVMAGGTLYCQIALTRLFSVVQYYHGAFLAISLALFGFAVSGVWVFVRRDSMPRAALDAVLARYALGFAVSVPLAFYFYLYAGFTPLLARLGFGGLAFALGPVLDYGLLALPFFCSGVCISLLLFHGARQANRLYAVDLCASSAGAILVVPALALLGGPKSMLVACAVAAGTAGLLSQGRRALTWAAAGVAVVAVCAASFVPASTFNAFRLRKPAFVVANEPILWNSFSMVGVEDEKQITASGPAGSDGPETWTFRRRHIVIDNSVVTAMIQSTGNLAELAFLRRDFSATAHRLRPGGDVLIIGSGAGRDVLVSLVHGARSVRAVEVNPLVVRMTNEVFASFTGSPYDMPGVTAVVGDARSYIANSNDRFDVILASLIDTWAASSAGAFALTENLLYTTDAYLDYYEHLNDDGILSISRWHPLETPRLLSTGLAAWREAGVEDPRQHAVLLLSGPVAGFKSNVSVLLLKKSPYTRAELSEIERVVAENQMTIALAPGRIGDPIVRQYLEAEAKGNPSGPWPGIDLSPATDERPFFFNMVKPSTQLLRMLGVSRDGDKALTGFPVNRQATRMLIQLLFGVSLLLFATVYLPLRLRAGVRLDPRWRSVFGYFSCLGLGFIAIEVGLLQRLILLLGQPVYSLALILTTMLFASGLGSWASGRLGPGALAGRLPWLLGALAVGLTLYAFGLPLVIDGLLGAPFPIRLGSAAAIVFVPAFFLGMPFPSGLRLLHERDQVELVPWVWGINGAMSVLASVASIALAIELGYTAVFLAGAGCYAVAALLLPRWARTP